MNNDAIFRSVIEFCIYKVTLTWIRENVALTFTLAQRRHLPSRHKPVIWSPFVRDLSHSRRCKRRLEYRNTARITKNCNEIRPHCRGVPRRTTAREFIVPVQLADVGMEWCSIDCYRRNKPDKDVTSLLTGNEYLFPISHCLPLRSQSIQISFHEINCKMFSQTVLK